MDSVGFQNFRSKIEKLGLLGNVDNNELERLLFHPGPDHLQLLHWCLLKLIENPKQKEVPEIVSEKSVFKLARSLGLCKHTEEAIIIGTAPRQKQRHLWEKLLYLLEEAKEIQENSTETSHVLYYNLLTTVVKTKDFWDLLATKINLIPVHLCLSQITESTSGLCDQIKVAEQKLQCIKKKLSESSQSSVVDLDVVQHTKNMNLYLEKINACCDILSRDIFVHLKGVPPNPACEQLGSIISAVADKIIGLTQTFQNQKNFEVLMANILSESTSDDSSMYTSELYDLISVCSSLLSEIFFIFQGIDKVGNNTVAE